MYALGHLLLCKWLLVVDIYSNLNNSVYPHKSSSVTKEIIANIKNIQGKVSKLVTKRYVKMCLYSTLN